MEEAMQSEMLYIIRFNSFFVTSFTQAMTILIQNNTDKPDLSSNATTYYVFLNIHHKIIPTISLVTTCHHTPLIIFDFL